MHIQPPLLLHAPNRPLPLHLLLPRLLRQLLRPLLRSLQNLRPNLLPNPLIPFPPRLLQLLAHLPSKQRLSQHSPLRFLALAFAADYAVRMVGAVYTVACVADYLEPLVGDAADVAPFHSACAGHVIASFGAGDALVAIDADLGVVFGQELSGSFGLFEALDLGIAVVEFGAGEVIVPGELVVSASREAAGCADHLWVGFGVGMDLAGCAGR